MTTRTITITIDVPDDMAASVNEEAYFAMCAAGADGQHRINTAHDAARMLRFCEDSPPVQDAIINLNAQARRIHDANSQVKLVLSQVIKAMSTIHMEWRRSQSHP